MNLAICDKYVCPGPGFLPPWGGNIDEASHDHQKGAGTSQGQTYTKSELRCSVPGPMQGFSARLHRGDGAKIWGERKGAQERC